jgi:hypothetical protein
VKLRRRLCGSLTVSCFADRAELSKGRGMGVAHFKFWIEFSLLAIVTGGLFLWGLVTGKTLMKAPLSASRDAEPIKYWMGQTFWGLWFLLCLYVAVTMMPQHISITIARTH